MDKVQKPHFLGNQWFIVSRSPEKLRDVSLHPQPKGRGIRYLCAPDVIKVVQSMLFLKLNEDIHDYKLRELNDIKRLVNRIRSLE